MPLSTPLKRRTNGTSSPISSLYRRADIAHVGRGWSYSLQSICIPQLRYKLIFAGRVAFTPRVCRWNELSGNLAFSCVTKQIAPLRQRMLDDLTLRNMSSASQRVYITAVKSFSEPGKPFEPNRKRYDVGVAVRNKYLLALDLADAGFDHTVLCEFRARLLAGDAAECLLARMLDVAHDAGLLKARGRQRTDSTHVLAAVRALNRLELLAETLRAALNAIAGVAPDW